MLYIAVCDDEEVILKFISKEIQLLFHKYNQDVLIEQFQNGKSLLDYILSGHHYDVLFLDVDMPSLSGIEIGKQLRLQADSCTIVFISNHDEFVFDSFRVNPFRYIRKSNFKNEIKDTIFDLNKELLVTNRLIKIHTQNNHVCLNPRNIIYIECNDKILKIVTNDKPIFMRYKLSDIQQELKEYGFIRIHKGYLVNFRYILSIEKNDVVLDSGEKLPISKYRVKDVINEFGRLIT